MKTRVLRVIQVFFQSGALEFIKVLSKLSGTILKMNKSGNKQENPLQEQTEEVSRKIGESTVDPQPTQPPTPVRLKNELQETEEISRKIGESTVTPQPPKPPNPVRVRKIGVATVTPQPKKPPRPVR
ncbi:MAG: hypothetical protein ACR2LR_21180 [Hassallia sp.]